jgi:uncharacterized caspase-like protein
LPPSQWRFLAPPLPPASPSPSPIPWSAPGSRARARALLVGVDRYRELDASGRPYFQRLYGSANDVRLFAELVKRAGGARAEDVRILLDEEAVEERVFAALNDLVAAAACGDFVVFHFSGHAWHGSLALHDASRGGGGTVTEGQLRRAVTAIRNRGAFAFVHLDASAPEHLELDVGRDARWRIAASGATGAVELGPDAGGFAGFHAGRFAFEQEIEVPGKPGAGAKEVYGLFTFATAAALGGGPLPTMRDLARRIGERMAPSGRSGLEPSPIFESTEPDRVMFATGLGRRLGPPPVAPTRGRVEILQPAHTRGVQLVNSAALRVMGRVTPAEGISGVLVSGAQARLLPGGGFEADVTLRPGRQTVFAVAVFADHSLAEDSVEVEGPVAPDPVRQGSHRYALVIGNARYASFGSLQTPVRDAEAVAGILADGFGFETSLPLEGGKSFRLLLRDAGRSAIYGALALLRSRLGPDDSVLIFYAGHGERLEKLNGSYWLPVDAQKGNEANWISADDIARQVRLMSARHVLIVSDSCFSGALLRGADLEGPPPHESPKEQRTRYLEEMGNRTSRHLLSSGANEPVWDGGGDGHSVFARAFLRALESMPEEAFTAGQLFAWPMGIQQPVVGNSRQVPQYAAMPDSGHDGGDFVFVRRLRSAAR